MNRLRIFIFNSIILTITSFLIRIINMLFNIYIANKIGSEGSGVFGLISSVFIFAITFANSGISLATTRIVGEEIDNGNYNECKIATKKCILYSLFFGLLACSFLIVFGKFISATLLHGKLSKNPIYLMAISLPFVSITSAFYGYFSGIRKAYKTSFTQIISTIIKFIIVYLLFYINPASNIEDSCTFLILANTISAFLEFLFTYILYFFEKKRSKKFIYDNTKYFARIIKIAFPVAITSYIRSGLSTLKHILIPLRLEKFNLSCTISLSQYGLINGMTLPVLLFPSVFINSFASLLIPELARYNFKKDYKKMNQVIHFILNIISFFSISIIVIFLIFKNEISYLIYNNYNAAKYIFILSPIIIFIYLDTVIDCMLKGLDEHLNVMLCNILDLFLSTILIYFLLPIYGISGYILVIYISEIFNFSISLLLLYKKSKFKTKQND